MSEIEEATEQTELNKTRIVAAFLATGGALLALVTLAWALARYWQLGQAGESSATGYLETTALLFAGVGGWLLLWGLAEVLRKLDSLLEAWNENEQEDNVESAPIRPPARPESSSQVPSDLQISLSELITLTREVRDISLLSESERAARLRHQGQTLVQQLQQDIPALLQEHRWVEARRRVQQARERFPTFSEWTELEERIEELRAKMEERDVETATRQVNDLFALDAWDRAAGLVRELLERHPNSLKARELVRRTAVQREKGVAEHCARMMAQAQEAVDRREWNRALSIANDLLQQHARSPEAEALRQQLPTLTENAEIQTRQQMENEFRDMMKQNRYQPALRLAREMIERYPNSPQADVLREQLPRLEKKVVSS